MKGSLALGANAESCFRFDVGALVAESAGVVPMNTIYLVIGFAAIAAPFLVIARGSALDQRFAPTRLSRDWGRRMSAIRGAFVFDRWSLLLWPCALFICWLFVNVGLKMAELGGPGSIPATILILTAPMPVVMLLVRYRPDKRHASARRERRRLRLRRRLGGRTSVTEHGS